MTTQFQAFRALIAVAVLALGALTPAHAEVYDFKFLRGGGGGSDPQKQRIAQGMGMYVCVDVRQTGTTGPGRVQFTLWSEIPEPYSRIVNFVIDTGRHADLITDVVITAQSSGGKFSVLRSAEHAFLPTITPDFTVGFTGVDVHAMRPGQFVTVLATLGRGRTFADVITALNQGMNSSNATVGLRLAVIIHHLLGKAPTAATIQDDGGFVVRAPSPRCQRR